MFLRYFTNFSVLKFYLYSLLQTPLLKSIIIAQQVDVVISLLPASCHAVVAKTCIEVHSYSLNITHSLTSFPNLNASASSS